MPLTLITLIDYAIDDFHYAITPLISISLLIFSPLLIRHCHYAFAIDDISFS
jgi:hypothetical protein